MNIRGVINTILAGGEGSGCHGENCGRPPGHAGEHGPTDKPAKGTGLKITTRSLKDNVFADDVSKDKAGDYTFRKGFFYRNGGDHRSWSAKLSKQLTDLGIAHTIKDAGEVNKAFRGGANTKNSSHWWVKVSIQDSPNNKLQK